MTAARKHFEGVANGACGAFHKVEQHDQTKKEQKHHGQNAGSSF
jgi:hypothetical protein